MKDYTITLKKILGKEKCHLKFETDRTTDL